MATTNNPEPATDTMLFGEATTHGPSTMPPNNPRPAMYTTPGGETTIHEPSSMASNNPELGTEINNPDPTRENALGLSLLDEGLSLLDEFQKLKEEKEKIREKRSKANKKYREKKKQKVASQPKARKLTKITKQAVDMEKAGDLEKFVLSIVFPKRHGKNKNKATKPASWDTKLRSHLCYDVTQRFGTRHDDDGKLVLAQDLHKKKHDTVAVKLRLEDGRYKGNFKEIDLFEIKKSRIPKAGRGVFAMQDFKAGSVIGIFYGTLSKKPSGSEYEMDGKDLHGFYINPESQFGAKNPIYFGLQFANDPKIREQPKRVTRSLDSGMSCHNFFIDQDLIARTCCDIRIGEELFLFYKWEGFDECMCNGCNYRKVNYEEKPDEL